ncbi:tRNA (guanosine(37)-N1)-methyltransferase TrmD [Sedimenticola hydrogenitrophicus]|uniref:tRNA (guanosine(37)-N1)-methyltransferase TrmD n=1 Tax=Sedimenticola hydrogenitrophicus TaxID=2967975 RepID=UPI0023B090D7|nr:tRNA (guanosine(37)-N1)-methyltransferase TrmD [Sedimenticola hydrogenitrophicus]
MRFDVVTLFPEMFRAMIGEGVTGRAVDRGQVSLGLWNPRDYTHDVHRTVDDRPYGGGPGMVMKIEPLRDAIAQARSVAPDSAVAYLSPQGQRFDQATAGRMARRGGMILIAGRYEGIDERLINRYVDEEWSIGDYVLSGGELPALVLMDAVIRLLPGVLGDKDSAEQDSFTDGLLDCPHYTRPELFEGDRVPAVLMGGNHELIRRWRLQQSLGRTWQRRPDLLEGRVLTREEEILLNEFIQAQTSAD